MANYNASDYQTLVNGIQSSNNSAGVNDNIPVHGRDGDDALLHEAAPCRRLARRDEHVAQAQVHGLEVRCDEGEVVRCQGCEQPVPKGRLRPAGRTLALVPGQRP